ncbi:hypothetical protein K491DRAFT_697237 [Lophiostoma macrostomum CBS 122681]|uniref:Uncharacterized protein n=1 Tax=Lophiostoma macrostomum CBS 122681 TaxID=1314788 RepID=A0A6A6SRT5_9PLEO|nr:hypothetical protein K491DRAFT_697237 [Lophiostoma macrostomum CBS 122681]
MPVVTITDYDNTHTHTPQPFSRQCPNLRTCWPGLSTSFNPFVADRDVALRRVAFLVILALRLLNTLMHGYMTRTSLSSIPATAINLLFFFFMAWNLHLIVECAGERKVLGYTFGRRSFDVFLRGLVIVHGAIFGMNVVLGWGGWDVLSNLVLLAIFGVAWVATWEAEDGRVSLV